MAILVKNKIRDHSGVRAMDEQRIQAYVNFIGQLLGCPQGQEGELLKDHGELVDTGLIEAMEQVAGLMESQGNSNAGWLRGFAVQLGEALRLKSTGTPSSEDAARFLLEMLQLVAQTRGNSQQQQFYSVWIQQQSRLTPELLAVMPQVIERLLSENIEQQIHIASVLVIFSNRIQEFPTNNRWLNLEIGIICYKWAFQVYTRVKFPIQWAATQNCLALAYSHRIQGNRSNNIDLAIKTYQLALQVRTKYSFPEDWAMTQNNLGLAYSYRIRGDRSDNFELALESYQLALQIRTEEFSPQQWAMTQNNLAIAYSKRIRGSTEENIELAISAYHKALSIYTYDAFPEQWAVATSNLANVYMNRIRGNKSENLELAIIWYAESLKVYNRELYPEDWARINNNMAITHSYRITKNDKENLKRAISLCQSALQVYTQDTFPEDWAMTQSNLANVYSKICGIQKEYLEHAISAYQLALQIYTRNDFPEECRQTAGNLGNLYFKENNWILALDTYAEALSAAEILYQNCILLDSKSAQLTETDDLPRKQAYVLAKTGNLRQAIETLEQGRARGLTESLDRDRSDLKQLEQLNPNLYTQYQTITEQLRAVENQQRDRMTSIDRHSITPEVLRETATNLRKQLENLIEDIRQVPSYERFLTLPKFEDVRQAVNEKCPLVYLTTTSAGSLALIVTPQDIQSIWLNDLNEQQLQEIIQTWFTAYNQSQTDRQTWHNTIDTTTRQLWEPLMQPLIQSLKTQNHHQATLIPTGFLSLLPLHAAWSPDTTKPTGRHYALDDIHLTYAPNAKSLTAAQTIAQTIHPTSILAIDNPTQNLPNSEREINAAINSFTHPIVLRHAEATVENVRSKLPEASIVHFSCHGTANLNDPLNSGLQMSDGLLTLRDILALNLAEKGGIRLAILSACETGLSGIDAIDEAISLPTGLLQAGVAGVISSLWSVSDLSTMLLLTKFYDLWQKENLEPSLALHQAQLWVRDTTSQEKANYFKPTHPDLFQTLILLPAQYFAHPFHWSAFSHTGI